MLLALLKTTVFTSPCVQNKDYKYWLELTENCLVSSPKKGVNQALNSSIVACVIYPAILPQLWEKVFNPFTCDSCYSVFATRQLHIIEPYLEGFLASPDFKSVEPGKNATYQQQTVGWWRLS